MSKVLFVNACVRENSRTRILADEVLSVLGGEITEVSLEDEAPAPLDRQSLQLRDEIVGRKDLSHPMLKWAVEFAEADEIVIAAPYWDLMFPAVLKSYFEAVTVSGVTFYYDDHGIPHGLCKAKRIVYVTTSGGPIIRNFGYEYAASLGEMFYGITETALVKAEGLDIWGNDVEAILAKAKEEINL